jgi:DNA-binding response OmpR family regulator
MPNPVFAFDGAARAGPAFTQPDRQTQPVLLLIDDEPLVGRFIGHMAEACGYRAVKTTGIDAFRRAYRSEPPSIVAVDLAVPGCDGVEILRFLAEEKCEAPVVIISGFDRRVLESSVRLGEAMGLNMAGLLQKPVLLHELAAMLTTCEAEAEA